MQRRRAAAVVAAFLLAALGTGEMLAVEPNPPVAPPGWVQEGGSQVFDLAGGARVHIFPSRSDTRQWSAPSSAAAGALAGYGIDYHGGPIVPAERVVSIYWSGSQIYAGGPRPGTDPTTGPGSSDGSLVGYFLNHLGGSAYYNINTTYADTVGTGHTVANSLAYTGYWLDSVNAPSGTQSVSDASIQSEILNGFASGTLTYDPSTVYAVFSSGSVNLGGQFATRNGYCAYHGDFSSTYGTVLYAVMPYDNAYPGVCTALLAPNGDPGADAEVNTLAHELEEANTDPQLNAWWNSTTGAENADQCAWNFGSQNLSGGQANITIGAKNFLVQQNWLNVSPGSCAQGYAAPTPDFALSATPASQTVTAGGTTGAYTVTVSPSNGFTGSVSLGASGLPAGASATFTPNSVTGGSGTSSLTIATLPTTPAGSYPVTVTGTSGSLSHTTSVTLVVNAIPTPDFSVTASPGSRSIRQGSSTTYTVTISFLNGFTGSVALGATGLPSGATSSFNPTSRTSSGSSTLTIQTVSGVRGSFTITITGTSGSLTHSVKVTLTITKH